MIDAQTADQAESFHGDKLYQQRARAALPLLVRQAKAQKIISYGDLAEELGMENPRTLNYPLGSVGKTLQELGSSKGVAIPPIQCLVVNHQSGLPGEGFDQFISEQDLRALTKRQRRAVIYGLLQTIFAYPGWDQVLNDLNLQPAPTIAAKLAKEAAARGFGGGESQDHKQLKAFVASHPELLARKSHKGEIK